MKYIKSKSYKDYVDIQSQTNKSKLNSIWSTKDELKKISEWIINNNIPHSFGICHGARNGYEVKTLRKLLNTNIIGTEISDTATQFENIIQWDFHDIKKEWVESVGFIYSNSWDHSYDFEKALNNWMKCLKPSGVCFLEWTIHHTEKYMNKADCFGISKNKLIALISKQYDIVDTFLVNGKGKDERTIIVIKNKEYA